MRAKIAIVAVMVILSICNFIDEPQAEEMQEKEQETTTEQPTVIIEEVAPETVAEPEPVYKFCDIPLSQELQIWLIDYCKEVHISHYLIMAMCERESQYNASAIGDNGRSLGIMQIQPRWHKWRMDKLGCDNLLDPQQNIIVGIDILLELYSKNEDVAWVLMAYNGGEDYATRNCNAGNISEYATYIMARAEEMESE